MDYPLLVMAVAMVVLWLAATSGAAFFRRRRSLGEDARDDYNVILAATLTLLGLIIGFSFSMAVSRYDERKTFEEGEANAIGTEYLRADLLPVADRERVRVLLRSYVDQRILFYMTRDRQQLRQIAAQTSQLQADLWSAVRAPGAAQPNPVVALAVAGMNDVLNSQGYTQAAWDNRIPVSAWALMGAIAVFSNILLGYGARKLGAGSFLLMVLPLVVSISFFLVADIDSPRAGMIRVTAPNVVALSEALRADETKP
jgi:hypothetical protein